MAVPAAAQLPGEDGGLVVRPGAGFEGLANEVAAELRRHGLPAEVGEAAPELIEAVPAGHVGLAAGDEGLRLTVGMPGGHTHAETLRLESPRSRADRREAARTIALAITNLSDEPAPAMTPPPSNGYTYLEYERAIPERQLAAPTLYFGLNVGYSPARQSAILGPGAGFGLCVKAHCVVIEAQLNLLAERTASRGGDLRYRFVNLGVRGQFRPLVRGRVSFGPTIGVVIRNGKVQLQGSETRDVASSVGFRGTAELAVRLAGPFEWVLEAGMDVAVTRAAWIRTSEVVFLEDRYTPFVVTALRLRPDFSSDR